LAFTLRRTDDAPTGAGGDFFSIYLIFLWSAQPLLSRARYVCSSRLGLAFPVEALVATSGNKVEVALSPDLRRGYGEARVTHFPLFGVLLREEAASVRVKAGFDGSLLLRIGCFVLISVTLEIPVSVHRNQEGSGLCWLMRRGLKSDVIVVKVSGLFPHVCAFWVRLEWLSMAIRTCLVASNLCRSFLFRHLIQPLREWPTAWLLVLSRFGCLDGSRESLAVFVSASHRSSHPGTVVLVLFHLRWCSRLSCVGCGNGSNPTLCRSVDGRSEHLLDMGCGSKCRVALHTNQLWWRRQSFVFETSPSVLLRFIDRKSYKFGGDHRELATPETSRELPASEATRRTLLSRESR
ncbi:LOW QUALITY PROTEIN: hypothetical protein HID58_072567, partial [Brassica napus]